MDNRLRDRHPPQRFRSSLFSGSAGPKRSQARKTEEKTPVRPKRSVDACKSATESGSGEDSSADFVPSSEDESENDCGSSSCEDPDGVGSGNGKLLAAPSCGNKEKAVKFPRRGRGRPPGVLNKKTIARMHTTVQLHLASPGAHCSDQLFQRSGEGITKFPNGSVMEPVGQSGFFTQPVGQSGFFSQPVGQGGFFTQPVGQGGFTMQPLPMGGFSVQPLGEGGVVAPEKERKRGRPRGFVVQNKKDSGTLAIEREQVRISKEIMGGRAPRFTTSSWQKRQKQKMEFDGMLPKEATYTERLAARRWKWTQHLSLLLNSQLRVIYEMPDDGHETKRTSMIRLAISIKNATREGVCLCKTQQAIYNDLDRKLRDLKQVGWKASRVTTVIPGIRSLVESFLKEDLPPFHGDDSDKECPDAKFLRLVDAATSSQPFPQCSSEMSQPFLQCSSEMSQQFLQCSSGMSCATAQTLCPPRSGSVYLGMRPGVPSGFHPLPGGNGAGYLALPVGVGGGAQAFPACVGGGAQAFSLGVGGGAQAFPAGVLPSHLGVLAPPVGMLPFPAPVLPFPGHVGVGSQALNVSGLVGTMSNPFGSFPPTYFGPVLPPLRHEQTCVDEMGEPAPFPELGETLCDPSLLLDLGVSSSESCLLREHTTALVQAAHLDSHVPFVDSEEPIQKFFEDGAQVVQDFLSGSML